MPGIARSARIAEVLMSPLRRTPPLALLPRLSPKRMAERDSFPVSCDIKGLRGGKFPSLATTSSETLPASTRPRTPLERHPEAHPSGAARLCGGRADERFARRRQILGARAFRSHTISGRGFSLLELAGGCLDRARGLVGGGESRRGVVALCTISWGSGASGAIPFPGADSIFSRLCGTICGRLRLAMCASSHGGFPWAIWTQR